MWYSPWSVSKVIEYPKSRDEKLKTDMPQSTSHQSVLFLVVFWGCMCVNPSALVGEVLSENNISPGIGLGEGTGVKNTSGFWFDQKNRRDPFLPLVSGEGNKDLVSQGTLDSPSTIFTQKVMGIILGSSGYWAMIQGEEGHRHMVQVGSILPVGGAKVTSINQEAVVLEWPHQLNRANSLHRQQVLKLGDSP